MATNCTSTYVYVNIPESTQGPFSQSQCSPSKQAKKYHFHSRSTRKSICGPTGAHGTAETADCCTIRRIPPSSNVSSMILHYPHSKPKQKSPTASNAHSPRLEVRSDRRRLLLDRRQRRLPSDISRMVCIDMH